MKKVTQDPLLSNICGKLYDIVDDNLRKSGNVMRFSRELTVSQTRGGPFDPFDFDDLSCHDFLMACYLRLLGRLPDGRLRSYPTPKDEVPAGCDADWCHSILPEFYNSEEFHRYHGTEDPPPPPPPPPPPLPPPPAPPRYVNKRLYFGMRSVLRRITPFFIRNAINSLLRHE